MWRLNCGIVNLTGARAAINLVGPCARDIARSLSDCILRLPISACAKQKLWNPCCVDARRLQLGEWGYENMPSLLRHKDALLEVGVGYGISPFGVEHSGSCGSKKRTPDCWPGYR